MAPSRSRICRWPKSADRVSLHVRSQRGRGVLALFVLGRQLQGRPRSSPGPSVTLTVVSRARHRQDRPPIDNNAWAGRSHGSRQLDSDFNFDLGVSFPDDAPAEHYAPSTTTAPPNQAFPSAKVSACSSRTRPVEIFHSYSSYARRHRHDQRHLPASRLVPKGRDEPAGEVQSWWAAS